MLIIKPIQDKEFQKEICTRCGFTFDPTLFAYSEKENDKLIAGCQFDILGKEAIIQDFGMEKSSVEDIEALIILGRAVLNFLELSGVETCHFETKSPDSIRYAKAIGFTPIENKMSISLKGLFDARCSHCK